MRKKLQKQFERLEKTSLYNTEKVLRAFKKHKLALRHFNPTTGYGYGDEGRDTLNAVLADIFGCGNGRLFARISSAERMRYHSLYTESCGRTILSYQLRACPYDTLADVINGEGDGSLKDFGVKFDVVPLKDNAIDKTAVKNYLSHNKPKIVFMQRSRGYEWRNALTIAEIEDAVSFIRSCGFLGCIFMDNCYGEFINIKEPTEVGVDLIAGSAIKNIGGGIAPTGGYIAGKKIT